MQIVVKKIERGSKTLLNHTFATSAYFAIERANPNIAKRGRNAGEKLCTFFDSLHTLLDGASQRNFTLFSRNRQAPNIIELPRLRNRRLAESYFAVAPLT